MTIAVIMMVNGREVSRYGRSQSMDDVLAYFRGFVSPGPCKGSLTATVQPPGEQPKTFALFFTKGALTVRPIGVAQ